MRNSELRLHKDMNHMHSEEFTALCRRSSPKHYTRNRKLPLGQLLLSVLFRKGRNLNSELRYFKDLFHMDSKISKPGYHKQRMKLNPLAFWEMIRYHAAAFYCDKSAVRLWKNIYLLVAADGSACNVPLTKENVEVFGNLAYRTPDAKKRPQIGISCLFDALNRMIIDLSTHRAKFDERSTALEHLETLQDVIGDYPFIFLADRGYPSAPFFINLMDNGTKFVIRLASTHFKTEQESMKSQDEWKEILFTQERVNPYKRNGKKEEAVLLESRGSITLRFVRIELPSGKTEYLITNLTEKEATTQDIKELYHLRWEVETAFDDMKNKLQLENFTGSKPILIEQDVYATGYLYNIMNDVIQDAETERSQSETQYNYKYAMQINRNVAAGLIKEEVIRLILETDRSQQEKIMDAIVTEIKSNLVPVRDNRHYPRSLAKASKYSNVKKRSY